MNKNLRVLVRGVYDIQKLRIQMGNRIVGNFKVKLGQEPGHGEAEMDKEGKEILKRLRASYNKITDGVTNIPTLKKFEGDEVISSYTWFCLMHQYNNLELQEAEHFKKLSSVLKTYPIYTEYLQDIKGIGPAMAGVIVSEIDITKATYASSLHMYAGLDVAPDGQGRSRKKEHLVDREYINKEGEPAIKKGITFNPFLKTKLIGVLGSSFLRAGENKYSTIYKDYKNRLENHPNHTEKSKGHRHNMAVRYMVKMFLIDLYAAWRELEGLEVAEPYHVAKLGLKHHAD